MEIVFITYESGLGIDEVDDLFRERADHYREIEGLLQKFYLHDEESRRVGGVYVFDSKESSEALFESDIHASLRDAYEARDVDIRRFHVTFRFMTLWSFRSLSDSFVGTIVGRGLVLEPGTPRKLRADGVGGLVALLARVARCRSKGAERLS